MRIAEQGLIRQPLRERLEVPPHQGYEPEMFPIIIGARAFRQKARHAAGSLSVLSRASTSTTCFDAALSRAAARCSLTLSRSTSSLSACSSADTSSRRFAISSSTLSHDLGSATNPDHRRRHDGCDFHNERANRGDHLIDR